MDRLRHNPPRWRSRFLSAVAALLLMALGAAAQDNETCLECHKKPDLKREGDKSSVHVDPKAYAASVHGTQECINCHFDLEEAEFPHSKKADRVECAECHEAQGGQHANSQHGKASARGDDLAPTCQACHGSHEILSHGDPKASTYFFNIPFLCAACHKEGSEVTRTHDIPKDKVFEHYSQSLHGNGVYKKGIVTTAVCTSCHTSHEIRPHTDPKSSIHQDNVAKTCMQCHALIERVHRKYVEGRLWEEQPGTPPACSECHPPHRLLDEETSASKVDQNCLRCHGEPDVAMERDSQAISLYVDQATLGRSVHSRNNVTCAQCHADVDFTRDRPCATVQTKVDCSVCHTEANDYRAGLHGQLEAQGDPDAPTCLDCHEKHATRDKRTPTSPTFPRNVPTLCSRCHREGEQAARRIESPLGDIVGSYEMSIHGRGLAKSGLTVTATCASCHTAHKELPPTDPGSSVHAENVADTCGECHHGIEETFKQSIHWPDNTDTDRELPTCEDCHSSHTITRVDATGFRVRMMDQCGRCHEEEASTFFDTYHGKVSRGSDSAAKCYDCHGTHNILPPSNPASTLGRNHVVETCAQCHAGAHRRFAGYLTHATHHDPETFPWLFWSFWVMTILLVGTLAFALLHTAAWLARLWLSRDEWQTHKALVAEADTSRLYRRFNRYQRLQHMLMLISFFTLALTGMALKFSYMGWAQGVTWLFGGFDTMGILHRMAGITLFIVFVLHLWEVRNKRKRAGKSWWQMITGPDSIILHPRDLKEVWASIKWFLGRGQRPRYGRWTYWEKFDYFAVFWGVAVIGTTGLILWFPEIFTYVIPGWFVNVATIIHSDEALLAVGFIFTIHFFNTHFRPDKFPMDPVIFTGRVTLEELKYDKPREYEALVASGELEKEMVDPFPKAVEHSFRVFGFIALGIGLLLIGLIVYTMLFGYR
ncbi:MAG: cytochrome b/b6 domain-containing protein [Planctomycetota bacterium]